MKTALCTSAQSTVGISFCISCNMVARRLSFASVQKITSESETMNRELDRNSEKNVEKCIFVLVIQNRKYYKTCLSSDTIRKKRYLATNQDNGKKNWGERDDL